MTLRFSKPISCSFFVLAIPCKLPENSTKNAQGPKERKHLYRTGETITLGCEIGYKGIGNGTQECNEGNWTTTDFYCESKLRYFI